mmetsp:Transcript_40025/g.103594  ORF Transcript_40025/g.103594 Transcript_40025/m.103594 type:complete len:311 (-) Transcript_40025:287-1219(-)
MALAVLRTQRTRSPSPSALLSILPQMAPRAHPSTLAALFAFGATWANASPTSNTTMLSTKLRGGLSAASVAASGTSAVDLGELESATSEMEQLEEKRSEEVPDIAEFAPGTNDTAGVNNCSEELPGMGTRASGISKTAAIDMQLADPDYLSSACNNGRYCVMNGYMVVAGRSDAQGIEDINGHNGNYYNSMMYAAHSQCGGSGCVLIVNPSGYRTQNRFHIHYRDFDSRGASLKHRLQSAVCEEGGWHSGGFPCGGKAKYFDGFPAVFSAAMGSGSISGSSVTVWPGSCGSGTIILVSYGCSIEHSISAR